MRSGRYLVVVGSRSWDGTKVVGYAHTSGTTMNSNVRRFGIRSSRKRGGEARLQRMRRMSRGVLRWRLVRSQCSRRGAPTTALADGGQKRCQQQRESLTLDSWECSRPGESSRGTQGARPPNRSDPIRRAACGSRSLGIAAFLQGVSVSRLHVPGNYRCLRVLAEERPRSVEAREDEDERVMYIGISVSGSGMCEDRQERYE